MTLVSIAPLALALQAAPAAPASPTPTSPTPAPNPASPAAAEPAPASAPATDATAPAASATPVAAPLAPASRYTPNAPAPPAVAGSEGATAQPGDDALKYRRLVFANFYALDFGIYPVPSGDFSFFLGTDLRPRRSTLGKDWNTAIGYQLTLSVGGADFHYGESGAVQSYFDDGLDYLGAFFFHRHALMAQGLGGRKGRLYYAMGAGAVMWRTVLVGVEGEARLGYAFWAREGARLRGIFGGQARLGGPFDGAPLPQFGLFIGFLVL